MESLLLLTDLRLACLSARPPLGVRWQLSLRDLLDIDAGEAEGEADKGDEEHPSQALTLRVAAAGGGEEAMGLKLAGGAGASALVEALVDHVDL